MQEIKSIHIYKDNNGVSYWVGIDGVTKIEWINVKTTLYFIHKGYEVFAELHEVSEVRYK